MKKFLIGLVTGFVLTVLTATVVVVALAWMGEAPPSVKSGSTLVVNLQGSVPERAAMSLPFPIFESRSPATVEELWRMLRSAARDPKIKAVALVPRGVGAGWGKMQELREGLLKFKESGKPLIAYLRYPSAREYYLATAADRIYIAPEDLLNVKGIRVEAMYLRQTLDTLGVEVEIEHAGKYKDAGDMFTHRTMSPETREVMDSVLDELYRHLLEVISEGRDKTPEEVAEILDQGPFLAAQAKELGLVDGLLYQDEVYDELASELGQQKLTKLSYHAYLCHLASISMPTDRQRIAVVVGSGTIIGGSGGDGIADDDAIWSRTFIRVLRQVRDDKSIKGVILRIDSPGGDAIASDEILREVRLLREKKPLVISMSDVAASGGYYIAMTGDTVVAYPNTFTGSIGVIYGKVNLRGLYDKLGIHKDILTRGRFAAIDSDYKPLSPEERIKLREGIDAVYDGFLARVSEGRNRPRDEIEPLAQGRVWLGIQAKRNGLVDELGGLDRAVELIKEKAGVPAEKEINLVAYPAKRSIWEYLMEQSGESLLGARLGSLGKLLTSADLQLLKNGRILRLMPMRFEVE